MTATIAARLGLACILCGSVSGLRETPAQSPQPQAPSATASVSTPKYDVSTFKLNTKGSFDVSVNTRDTTLVATNVPVKDLLQDAFGVRRSLIFGLPGWAENARYDINAKVLDATPDQLKKLTREQRRDMMRMLCEERLGLKWHFESRTLPAYELVVAKDGPKIKPTTANDDNSGTSMNNTDLTVTNIPLSIFTTILSNELERPVVDRTGLTGRFDFKLKWTREQDTPADKGQDSDAPPPLFTAVQEQLGLKLQPGKDSVQVLVVDSISQPAEN